MLTTFVTRKFGLLPPQKKKSHSFFFALFPTLVSPLPYSYCSLSPEPYFTSDCSNLVVNMSDFMEPACVKKSCTSPMPPVSQCNMLLSQCIGCLNSHLSPLIHSGTIKTPNQHLPSWCPWHARIMPLPSQGLTYFLVQINNIVLQLPLQSNDSYLLHLPSLLFLPQLLIYFLI